MTQTLAPPAPAQAMTVRYEGGERYEITVRDHTIVADQPADVGGSAKTRDSPPLERTFLVWTGVTSGSRRAVIRAAR